MLSSASSLPRGGSEEVREPRSERVTTIADIYALLSDADRALARELEASGVGIAHASHPLYPYRWGDLSGQFNFETSEEVVEQTRAAADKLFKQS